MSVFVVNFPCCALWKSKKLGFIKPSTLPKQMSPSSSTKVRLGNNDGVKAFFFNPTEEPILREALKGFYLDIGLLVCSPDSVYDFVRASHADAKYGFKMSLLVLELEHNTTQSFALEPVAFMGGMFAGLLRLDLNEDPLKDWVSRTVEASGITEEEIDASGLEPEEEAPLQIEIE
ncbi:hypothetical protein ACE6H2_018687 [Prunus campanulata]